MLKLFNRVRFLCYCVLPEVFPRLWVQAVYSFDEAVGKFGLPEPPFLPFCEAPDSVNVWRNPVTGGLDSAVAVLVNPLALRLLCHGLRKLILIERVLPSLLRKGG